MKEEEILPFLGERNKKRFEVRDQIPSYVLFNPTEIQASDYSSYPSASFVGKLLMVISFVLFFSLEFTDPFTHLLTFLIRAFPVRPSRIEIINILNMQGAVVYHIWM